MGDQPGGRQQDERDARGDDFGGVAPVPGAQGPAKKKSNTTLIVLGVLAGCGCVAIPMIAVIAAIAIPNLLRSKLVANEMATIAALRTYAGAQNVYHRTDYDGDGILEYCTPANAEAPSFTYLNTTQADGWAIELIDGAFAKATMPTTPKAGYYFVDITHDVDGNPYDPAFGYALAAVPAQYDRTGVNTFVIDVQGTVFQADMWGEGAPTQFPDVTDPDGGWLVCE